MSVLRCRRCGVLLLSSTEHATLDYYEEKEHPELQRTQSRERVVRRHATDTERRARLLGPHVADRDWLDLGTGAGGILEALEGHTRSTVAIEPQAEFRKSLQDAGHIVHRSLEAIPEDATFDVITAFHVIEHVPRAIDLLSELRSRLREGGLLVVEVPHAKDVLISLLRSPAFLDHTFWSEHLLLHTRLSLERFLEAAGFSDVQVRGVQRYPLPNHLHWLARGAPDGHIRWPHLTNDALHAQYEATLSRLDMTDTLIAYARSPGT